MNCRVIILLFLLAGLLVVGCSDKQKEAARLEQPRLDHRSHLGPPGPGHEHVGLEAVEVPRWFEGRGAEWRSVGPSREQRH